MRERALRAVLLIKAVEEADREGTLLPAADRAAATRDAARAAGHASEAAAADGGAGPLPARAERLLADRAQRLEARLSGRFPVVGALDALARGSRWVAAGLLLASLAAGLSLSALDGSRRINVLAFPLLGLVGWNLLAYAATVIRVTRAWRRAAPVSPAAVRLLARAALGRLRRVVARTATFNAPLADALGRFLGEWLTVARPLLLARASRVLHLAAAAVGLGLIAGLYLRGIALDYQAGWESTFLTAEQARRVLAVAYGPAAWATGIPVPDAAHLAAIRWAGGQGGENAAPWLHLMAATALLFVVAPRLALAGAATLVVWRRAWRTPPPPALVPYFRSVFSPVAGVVGRGIVALVPYAQDPPPAAAATLRRLLPAALGDNLIVDVRPPVRYGDEDAFLRQLPEGGGAVADAIALLFGLAATPEEQAQGHVIAGVRDWLARARPHAQLLVLLDESAYARRMRGPDLEPRLAERRAAWEAFVAAHGLRACVLDLGEAPGEAGADPDAVARVRAALWQPVPA